MKGVLIIRADASVAMGTGHLMRMIALAQAWREGGGEAVFLCAEITPPLEQRIKDEGFRFERLNTAAGGRDDLEATHAAITRYFSDGITAPVVLDGYQFDADFQIALKNAGSRLLVVDDYGHADGYHADLLLNQNVSAREEIYPRRDAGTHLLLGPKYALLRREFLESRGEPRRIPDKASKLLVTLGGADADNVTKKIIDALAASGLEVKVAVGGSSPHLSSLRQAAEAATGGATRVELVVNARDMPELMKWADMAVAAAGSTSWELAFTGLPALFVILAENQAKNARELERQGFGLCLGEHSVFDGCAFRETLDRLAGDHALRADFASRGKEMVDGLGAQRVASYLRSKEELEFHPVTEAEIELLWEWANDPDTRANSFESSAIPWEQHEEWCRSKLGDPQCSFWVCTNANLGKMGVVRFDCRGAEATISVSLAPHARGKGYGRKLIKAACSRIFVSSDLNLIRALIKPTNNASIRAFERAGFQRDAGTMVKGQPAEQYLLHRSS